MKTTFIYALVDPRDNNPCYIGKANNPIERFEKGHLNTKHKTKKASWIKSLLKQNLQPILEIIDEVSINEWQFWEQYYISLYKSWGFDLSNLTIGGDGIPYPSNEMKNKMSISHKGQIPWNKGKNLSEQHCKNLSLGQTGKIKNTKGKTFEQISGIEKGTKRREQRRESMKGTNLYDRLVKKGICPKEAKIRYEESERKRLETRKNYKHSLETIKNIKKSKINPVIQLTLDNKFVQEFDNILAANKHTKCQVGACLRGKQKTSGNYKFIYKKNWNGIT